MTKRKPVSGTPRSRGKTPTERHLLPRLVGGTNRLLGTVRVLSARAWEITWVKQLVAVIVIATLAVGVFVYLTEPVPTKINCALTHFGDVTLSYYLPQSRTISPACGGEEKHDDCYWKGITFLARDIEISNKADEPLNCYCVTAAVPEPISVTPEGFRFSGYAYSILLPIGKRFDPRFLLRPRLPAGYQVLMKNPLENVDRLEIYTEGKLNVALAGSIPVVSWVPTNGSRVSLNLRRGIHATSKAEVAIKEVYQPWSKSDMENAKASGHHESLDIPFADVIGRSVLWTESPAQIAAVRDPEQGVLVNPAERKGYRTVTAVVIMHPPFASRIACLACSDANYMKRLKEWHEKLTPTGYHVWSRSSGSVTLRIADAERADVSENVRKRLRLNDRTVVSGIWMNPDSVWTVDDEDSHRSYDIRPRMIAMKFRYPPLPRTAEFNIYGSLSYLRMSEAQGPLTVEARPVNLMTRYELELRKVRQQKVNNDIIPVRITQNQATCELQCVSEVLVNGKEMNTVAEEDGLQTQYVVAVCTVVPAIAAVLAFAAPQKRQRQRQRKA